MKKLLAIITVAAITAMAGSAMASGTANLQVTATVIPTCTMTGGTLAFGNLDPTNPAIKTADSSGVTITCTTGTPYTLGGDAGDNNVGTQKRLAFGTNYIPYSVTIPAGGSGTAVAQTVTIAGTIAADAYTSAPPGTYSDTIELTVTP